MYIHICVCVNIYVCLYVCMYVLGRIVHTLAHKFARSFSKITMEDLPLCFDIGRHNISGDS